MGPSPARLLAVIELHNAILAAGLNGDEIMRLVAERATSITSATGGLIGLIEGEEIVYRVAVGSVASALGTRVPKSGSLVGECISERKPVKIDDATTDARTDAALRSRAAVRSFVVVPLLYGEHVVGVLEVVSAKAAAFSEDDVETLPLLAQIIAISLHRTYTYPRPRFDTMHDALTGLSNRKAFEERIRGELGRNRRYGHSFSLAMLDLDGLENINDRLGQAAADEVLREIATILRKHTRVIDACFRLSSDEFAVVMPGTSLDGARILAERFRGHVSDARLSGITASFGVVESADETPEALVERATAALEADKRAHRAS